jgi:hypothetical protein
VRLNESSGFEAFIYWEGQEAVQVRGSLGVLEWCDWHSVCWACLEATDWVWSLPYANASHSSMGAPIDQYTSH